MVLSFPSYRHSPNPVFFANPHIPHLFPTFEGGKRCTLGQCADHFSRRSAVGGSQHREHTMRSATNKRANRTSLRFASEMVEHLEPRLVLSGSMGPMVDDALENNNSLGAVRAKPESTHGGDSANLGQVDGEGRIVLSKLQLADRRDLYQIKLDRDGGEFDYVRLNHSVRRGNLDLMLLNNRGKVVARSQNNGNVENISLDGMNAGTYFIQVIGRKFQTNPNYQLSISVDWKLWEHPFGDDDAPLEDFPVGNLPDDPYETNNDTIGQVRQVPVGPNSPNLGQISSSFNLQSLKLSDTRDIYRFELSAPLGFGSSIRIHAFEAMNVILFNSLGSTISLADGYNGNTSLSLGGLGAGEYFVAVTHYALDNPPGFDYWLEFTLPAAA